MIYLDHAAATPLAPEVLTAMEPYFSDIFYNPSATYAPAKQAREALLAARSRTAHWLGVRPSEIIFTAGGTEANNLAIHGVLRRYPNSSIVVSAIEHDSVSKTAEQYHSRVARVTDQGRVDVVDLAHQIQDDTVLVSVMYANNEIGTMQPLRQVAAQVAGARHARKAQGNPRPLFFHTDACQAPNYLDLHVEKLGVDLMTLNGGKVYGPKQAGALYVSRHVQLEPLLYGGGQEQGLRSGTENVSAAIGLAAALDQAQTIRTSESTRLNEVKNYAIDLLGRTIPHALLNGSSIHRLPNNLHYTFPGFDNERLLLQLEQRGILAAAGSACGASSDEPSHVLRAIGLSEEAARSSLRFTMGRTTQQSDIEKLVFALTDILKSK